MCAVLFTRMYFDITCVWVGLHNKFRDYVSWKIAYCNGYMVLYYNLTVTGLYPVFSPVLILYTCSEYTLLNACTARYSHIVTVCAVLTGA